jgi:hypothetical protein
MRSNKFVLMIEARRRNVFHDFNCTMHINSSHLNYHVLNLIYRWIWLKKLVAYAKIMRQFGVGCMIDFQTTLIHRV